MAVVASNPIVDLELAKKLHWDIKLPRRHAKIAVNQVVGVPRRGRGWADVMGPAIGTKTETLSTPMPQLRRSLRPANHRIGL